MPDQTQQDAERVERWARELCRVNSVDPEARLGNDDTSEWKFYRDDARAAIALADQEAVPDRTAMAKRLLSLHGADLKDLDQARRHVDYILDGEG